MRYAGLGFQLVGAVLGSMLIGHWLDQWIEPTFPVFLLCGALLGIVTAMIMLFRLIGKK